MTSSGYSRVSGAIDHVCTLYRYPGGPVVTAEGSWSMAVGFGFNMAFTVNFEQATVDYDLARGADALRLFVPGAPATSLRPDGGDGYVGEIRHFVESIRTGRAPETVTPHDALSAVEICEAEEASILRGETMMLP